MNGHFFPLFILDTTFLNAWCWIFSFFFFPSVFQGLFFFLLYHFFLAVTTPGSLGVQ